jgi:hypothetical protein
MGFTEWWRENETGLACEHFREIGWRGIYLLLRKAYEAGAKSKSFSV